MKLINISLLLLLCNSVIAQQVINVGGSGQGDKNIKAKGIENGQPIPDIQSDKLMNSDKQAVSLNEMKGKIIILEFWATCCGPCIPATDDRSVYPEDPADSYIFISVTYLFS